MTSDWSYLAGRLLSHTTGLGDNDFGCFCVKQNVAIEANLAFKFSRGGQVPPTLPMPADARLKNYT